MSKRASLIEQVRTSERRLRTIIDTEPACVKLLSADGVLLEMNQSGLAMIGADDAKDVVGRPVLDLVHPEDRDRFKQMQAAVAAGFRARLEFRMIGLKGEHRWLEMHAVPFEPATSVTQGSQVLSVTNDVTERKQLEDQLRQAQKLEAVGRLAGGVAHDFNNLAMMILASCDAAMEKIPADSELHHDLTEIRGAANRAAALVQQLLAFSRKQVLRPRVLDLNATVERLLRLLPRVLGVNVTVAADLAPQLRHVKADETQLDQIVMNLAVNARDAMPEGGTLRVATSNANLQSSPVPGVVGFRPGPYVLLEVADTGTGMTPEVLAQAFEPFFTTKEIGHGSGLGLSTVYGIVKQSGGYITVKSAPGAGTVFVIYLPAASEPIDDVRPS